MNHLPEIDPALLKQVSEQIEQDWREYQRETGDPWRSESLKVGAYMAALLIVIGVAHLISTWGMQ